MTDDFERIVPERFRAQCEFCGHPLDVRQPGSHQWVAGWVKVRSGGGGHGVSCPERANRWAHGHCVDRAASGQAAGQTSLFR